MSSHSLLDQYVNARINFMAQQEIGELCMPEQDIEVHRLLTTGYTTEGPSAQVLISENCQCETYWINCARHFSSDNSSNTEEGLRLSNKYENFCDSIRTKYKDYFDNLEAQKREGEIAMSNAPPLEDPSDDEDDRHKRSASHDSDAGSHDRSTRRRIN
ncbi:uncharacterized protein L201_005698 [Kwoniella dendrophila CBS 6074]|uniref:Uncharacterized protein n=1 Tax=Kwoniella dendrophila CBS 6074 TaxID=1295534 RepID=A0AAX4JZ49_9TREE